MNIDYSKVYVKNGNATKPVLVDKLIIDGKPLGELLGDVKKLHKAYTELTEQLKDCYIVKKDASYIIEVDNELKRIDSLKLFEEKDTQFDLRFYEIKEGEIVLNKKKVGAL